MGVHEYVLAGLLVVSLIVVAVEIRRSKRPRPDDETALDDDAAAWVPPTPRGRSVLLVGHTGVMRVSLRRALEQRMKVEEAKDTAEALACVAALADTNTDLLVIMDLPPGDGDGSALIEAVRAEPSFGEARVMMLVDEETDQPAPAPAPAPGQPDVEYVPKPASPKFVLDRIFAPRD